MSAPSATGVLYADGDYAGIFRRFTILGVDFAALAALWGVVAVLAPDARMPVSEAGFYAGVALSWAYLVPLEAFAGTPGFWLTGTRVVTLEGGRPTLLRMTFRLLLWIFGPINAFVDLFWMAGDAYKQTLRDKFAGTLVVKKTAIPVGRGEIRLNRYQIMGWSFVFYEVTRPPAVPTS
jgi:uncharacterized RDD family membrane protein YckC